TAHHHIAVRVDAVNLENRLCDVETDRRDRLHGCLLRIRPPHRRPWHLRADEGAVHSIKSGHSSTGGPPVGRAIETDKRGTNAVVVRPRRSVQHTPATPTGTCIDDVWIAGFFRFLRF